jgi:hypothetical protein
MSESTNEILNVPNTAVITRNEKKPYDGDPDPSTNNIINITNIQSPRYNEFSLNAQTQTNYHEINYHIKLNGIVQLCEIIAESHRVGIKRLCQLNTLMLLLVVVCSLAITMLSLIASADLSNFCDEKYKISIAIFSCLLTILQSWKHKLKLCNKILVHQQCQLEFLQLSQEVTSNLISVQLFYNVNYNSTQHHPVLTRPSNPKIEKDYPHVNHTNDSNTDVTHIDDNNEHYDDHYSHDVFSSLKTYPAWISDIYAHMSNEYLRLCVSRPSFDPWFIRPKNIEQKRQNMHYNQFNYYV